MTGSEANGDKSPLPLNVRNRYLALHEFATGMVRPTSLPSELQFALNNLCNFECVYCSDQRPGNTIPRTELAGHALDDMLTVLPHVELLAFHGISEFFIDKRFFDLVNRCAQAGARLSLNTNGSVATERHLNLLATYPGFLQINFSLDAATPATFLRIRGWDFERVLANIRAYMQRFAARHDRTWTSVSYVITKSNVHELVPFVRLGKELEVNEVKFYRLHQYTSLDWNVRAADGSMFDYRGECTDRFKAEYNDAIRAATAAAQQIGIELEIPALYAEDEVKAGPS